MPFLTSIDHFFAGAKLSCCTWVSDALNGVRKSPLLDRFMCFLLASLQCFWLGQHPSFPRRIQYHRYGGGTVFLQQTEFLFKPFPRPEVVCLLAWKLHAIHVLLPSVCTERRYDWIKPDGGNEYGLQKEISTGKCHYFWSLRLFACDFGKKNHVFSVWLCFLLSCRFVSRRL